MAQLWFGLSEEQETFRKIVRKFAEEEIKPKIAEYELRGEWPWPIWKKMAKNGLIGLPFPSEYGGQDADFTTTGIAAEEIARAGGPYAAYIWGLLIAEFGSEKQKERWLPKICKGDVLIGIGSTEPGCGSDAASITTKAEKKGDIYIINGEKQNVSHVKEASAFIITARTSPAPRHRGISTILVELAKPGIERYYFKTLGWWSHSFGGLRFRDVEVPVDNLIGVENRGFKQLMQTFDVARVLLSLWAIGLAQGSLEEAMEYAKQRRAFGKPIARFEAIQFKIAEDYTELEAARLLCYKALWLRDQGMKNTKEAAMAKYFGLKAAQKTLDDVIQIYGAPGITTELDHERRFRDVRIIRIGDGTDEIMKIIIARELLGRAYLPYER